MIEEYNYDVLGMRTKKIYYATSGTITTSYVYLGNNVLYEIAGTLATKYIIVDGKEIARVKGTATFFTHRDHLGSSSVVTDGTGNVIQWNANHPYGEDWQVDPPTTTNIDKHRFTGKETDTGSGLIYFGARYYDPVVGRFTTVDPDWDGLNWYEYCQDNPVNKVDPDGKEVITAIALYLGAVAASPDTAMDVQFISMDVAEGNWVAAGLDTDGMLIPGVTGLGRASKVADDGVKAVAGIAKGSSKVLARNMAKEGIERGLNQAAHHIVAAGSKYKSAVEARGILTEFGIDINSAVNGIFLGSAHNSIHTHKYYDEVLKLLKQATTKEEAIETLNTIGKDIKNGSFPK